MKFNTNRILLTLNVLASLSLIVLIVLLSWYLVSVAPTPTIADFNRVAGNLPQILLAAASLSFLGIALISGFLAIFGWSAVNSYITRRVAEEQANVETELEKRMELVALNNRSLVYHLMGSIAGRQAALEKDLDDFVGELEKSAISYTTQAMWDAEKYLDTLSDVDTDRHFEVLEDEHLTDRIWRARNNLAAWFYISDEEEHEQRALNKAFELIDDVREKYEDKILDEVRMDTLDTCARIVFNYADFENSEHESYLQYLRDELEYIQEYADEPFDELASNRLDSLKSLEAESS